MRRRSSLSRCSARSSSLSPDSPLEGGGFEPPVPRETRHRFGDHRSSISLELFAVCRRALPCQSREFESPVLEDDRANSQPLGNGCASADRSKGRVAEPEVRIHLPPALSHERTGLAAEPIPRFREDV